LSTVGDALGGVGALVGAFSDPRLKTNVQKIGTTADGHNLYSWDWNEEGTRLAGDQPTIGVMADEVPDDYVIKHESGYLMVDYGRL
jgi:hypothetical protein